MSINQRSGRQTFRRRFVSGSLFVSQCPPECSLQSETKFEPDLRSLSPGAGCAKRGGPWTSQAPTSTKRCINPSYVFSVNKKDFIIDSTTFRKLYNLILTLQLYIKRATNTTLHYTTLYPKIRSILSYTNIPDIFLLHSTLFRINAILPSILCIAPIFVFKTRIAGLTPFNLKR